ncbi:hypothetical protein pb186bvf_005341 [Paramecium bursaria]
MSWEFRSACHPLINFQEIVHNHYMQDSKIMENFILIGAVNPNLHQNINHNDRHLEWFLFILVIVMIKKNAYVQVKCTKSEDSPKFVNNYFAPKHFIMLVKFLISQRLILHQQQSFNLSMGWTDGQSSKGAFIDLTQGKFESMLPDVSGFNLNKEGIQQVPIAIGENQVMMQFQGTKSKAYANMDMVYGQDS